MLVRQRGVCVTGIGLALAGLALVGCKKTDDSKLNYTNAINTYYASHPACLWPDPIKFPVQADTSDTSKTSGYDALVDQGLLTRTTAEKKVFIVASKQVTNYDLSDKGRSSWTPDQQNPGYGNFCYGNPQSFEHRKHHADQRSARRDHDRELSRWSVRRSCMGKCRRNRKRLPRRPKHPLRTRRSHRDPHQHHQRLDRHPGPCRKPEASSQRR